MSSTVAISRARVRAYDAVLPTEQKKIAELNALAFRCLENCFEPKRRLFYRRLPSNGLELHREVLSSQSTLVALLGLHSFSEAGANTGLDLSNILAAVLEDASWISGPRDWGLLIWACALCTPDSLGTIFSRFADGDFFNRRNIRECRTRDLAILLAALAHMQIVAIGNSAEVADLAVEVYHGIEERQSESGIFGYKGRSHFVRSLWHERFGAVSDQALCIYSLAKFAEMFEVEEPLDAAIACADALCRLQGPLGQWWCLYDKKRGCVARAYPVLSECQGGLAPMALLALANVTGMSFDEPISKGLRWFFGANEAAIGLAGRSSESIWESIDVRGSSAMARNYMSGFMGIPRTIAPEALVVCRNAQVDVFGWMLFAFGGFGLDHRTTGSATVL